MGLVNYTSDSDSDSDSEGQEPPPSLPSPIRAIPKPAETNKPFKSASLIQKDSSGARKVLITLDTDTNADSDEPPSKRPKLGGGSSGLGAGLNAFLPAPKKSGANKPAIPQARASRVLGSGAARKEDENLVVMPWEKDAEEEEGRDKNDLAGPARPNPPSLLSLEKESTEKQEEPEKKPTIMTTTAHFIPHSVARKPIIPASVLKKKSTTTSSSSTKPPAKVSLFGQSILESTPTSKSASTSTKPPPTTAKEYKPLIVTSQYLSEQPANTPSPSLSSNPYLSHTSALPEASEPEHQDEDQDQDQGQDQGQDLTTLAHHLNLPDSALRQLQGRRAQQQQPVTILNFNVDEQYNINEQQIRLGLSASQQANPVRSIAPGKHQLRSLLNAAQSQRTALEESFAQGKRNKNEAGRKYGW